MNERLTVERIIEGFPRARLMNGPTPLERLDRLSDHLDIDLWLKRDDLTGLSFGGNKTRQLEFYFGDALARKADTILITGAVQSNFVRAAAAAAARLGMNSVLQLEKRVPGMSEQYYVSGNVLLAQILGAEHIHYEVGEDEYGADAALHIRADELRAKGKVPYIIHLGPDHQPLGALGYVAGAAELLGQMDDFDAAVIPSGSGSTHCGFLTGLRMSRNEMPVYGICVRRAADSQRQRLEVVLGRLAPLVGADREALFKGIVLDDAALAPGYGLLGEGTREALTLMAKKEGIFLDPVYTAKSFAGLLKLVRDGTIHKGSKVVLLHSGGLPALFAYQRVLAGT